MKPTYEELERQLEESRREFRAADATIHNLELKLTDQAVQLANAESKCRELQRDNDSLEAVAVSMRDDMRDAREKLEELDNAICELLPGTQYMDPPDGGSVTPLEQVRRMVADYRNRIAYLESQTVTVKLPADYRNDDGSINADMFNTCAVVSAFREALAVAGIGVKGE
ncbi:hypothetical protein [Citrobacter freundii]|uniref:hypothetical protein n=1 Tax=Citrobacter freundii TaxID=546 RepID=UPI0029DB7B26|nr:hypothetical protein [Citrobacter freundii]MDX7389732.1 hypothetical protein [Citrobacter freundii]